MARRARLATNYLHVEGVLLAEITAAAAFDRLDWLSERSRQIMRANRRLVDGFLADNKAHWECVPPDAGPICFPRLRNATGKELAALLRERYETSVVDGQFFAAPAGSAVGDCARHIRIAFGNETATVREGLSRVSQALADLASASNPPALSRSVGAT